MRHVFKTSLLTAILTMQFCAAQEAVQVGKGSYASFPPPGIAKGKPEEMEKKELNLVTNDGRPIPTNKWWTHLLFTKQSKSVALWSYPLRVDTTASGLDIFFPTGWDDKGSSPVSELPLGLTAGGDFKAGNPQAKDWSDWAIAFRIGETQDKYMDVTLGEGMPYVWVECHGAQPVLTLPKDKGAIVDAKYFDITGRPVAAPVTGDCLGIAYGGRQYGVFAPDGTRFSMENGAVNVEFTGKSQFLVVCPLPSQKDFEYFHRYAYAIPRDTKISWQYDAAKGMVATNWKITTELLKGTEKQIIQGWIPHHYRITTNNLSFNNLEYLTPRGKLRCTTGNEFTISYPYQGILPNLPAPKKIGGTGDYDSARLHTYFEDLLQKPKFGADTYWGGKDILRFGQCALMAQQAADPDYKKFCDALRDAMADWYTYTPGKKDHFFIRYPRWKALIGINSSYGSDGFNDNHFHYGYFTFATALLSMHDRQFASDYGPMATLVAKQYANWDRTDKEFPFLRTFDIWQGHSWAGGTGSQGGNNQESSSEAVQSWAGLLYLGQALGNKEMTDTGIMGYAMETEASLEYWFNIGGDVFPPEWKHPVTGMVWSAGKVYGTYFTGDPAWIYGIQWLPASPMLSYLVRDPAFARKSYENMIHDYEAHEQADAAKAPKPGKQPHVAKPAEIKSFGSGLGSVMLGYVLMYDPDWAAQQLDTLWNEPGDNIAHNAGEMTVMYYQAHAMRSLGLVDWKFHGGSPTSMVYYNAKTGIRTFVVWNPQPKAETVVFYEGNKPAGQMIATPQALTSVTKLSPVQ